MKGVLFIDLTLVLAIVSRLIGFCERYCTVLLLYFVTTRLLTWIVVMNCSTWHHQTSITLSQMTDRNTFIDKRNFLLHQPLLSQLQLRQNPSKKGSIRSQLKTTFLVFLLKYLV